MVFLLCAFTDAPSSSFFEYFKYLKNKKVNGLLAEVNFRKKNFRKWDR